MSKEDVIEIEGTVIEALPNAMFQVELANGIEGLIKIENLRTRRKLVFDQKNYTLSDGKVTYKSQGQG